MGGIHGGGLGGIHGGGLLAMMGGALPSMGGQITFNMDIPKNMVGRCIGKGGAQIKQLTADSAANLSIDQNVDPPKMTIVGTQEQVDKAKMLVQALLDRDNSGGGGFAGPGGVPSVPMGGMGMGGMGVATLGGSMTETVVPLGNCVLGKIIGKGGETIRNLKTQSGVERIQLDKDAPGGAVCRITGTEQAVQMAAQLVTAIVNDDPMANQIYGADSAPGGGRNQGGYSDPYAQQQQMYAQQQQQQQQMYPQAQQMALPAYMMGGMQQQQMMMMQMMQQQAPPATAIATQPAQPTPPVGGSAWQKVDDPATGRSYYWNAATQQSSWEPPPDGM